MGVQSSLNFSVEEADDEGNAVAPLVLFTQSLYSELGVEKSAHFGAAELHCDISRVFVDFHFYLLP